MIPYGCQTVDRTDIEAVIAVLRSEWLTQGPQVPRFESALARYCGASHGVAVNSATSALHLACQALGIGTGDIVWTTPITFVASANCARMCGADVDFVDIDISSGNMSLSALAEKLVKAEQRGQLPKVLIPVHFAGLPCPMAEIAALARRYGFRVIEDASHAVGARHGNDAIGACRHSDITVFSFHPVKLITTGEGGMALTNDESLANHMRRLRSHGITRQPQEMSRVPPGDWYYEQIELGCNYRMTDIQAALGLSQLEKLDRFVEQRSVLAEKYDNLLADMPVDRPSRYPDHHSAWHLYVVRIQPKEGVAVRDRIFRRLREANIGAQVHYIPVHTQPYYRQLGFSQGDFPEAERHYAEAITLPLFPGLTLQNQQHVVNVLRAAINQE